MNLRGVVALAAVGLVAYWVWGAFFADGPVPSDQLVEQLAEDDWGSGFCYDHDTQWPCIIPTRIVVDRSDSDYEARDKGTPYKRCFQIYAQVESTPWNYSYGGPSEPRTYIEATKPLTACADVTYFGGDADQTSSWSFTPTDDPPWYSDTVDALHKVLCGTQPYGAQYNCLP